MNQAFEAKLQGDLDALKKAGTYKHLRHLTTPMAPEVHMEEAGDVIVLSSNNYLGLADQPEVVEAGKRGLDKYGKKHWNKLVEEAIEQTLKLFNWDHLYLGGWNTKKIDFKLPEQVTIVSNETGLLSSCGIRPRPPVKVSLAALIVEKKPGNTSVPLLSLQDWTGALQPWFGLAGSIFVVYGFLSERVIDFRFVIGRAAESGTSQAGAGAAGPLHAMAACAARVEQSLALRLCYCLLRALGVLPKRGDWTEQKNREQSHGHRQSS